MSEYYGRVLKFTGDDLPECIYDCMYEGDLSLDSIRDSLTALSVTLPDQIWLQVRYDGQNNVGNKMYEWGYDGSDCRLID